MAGPSSKARPFVEYYDMEEGRFCREEAIEYPDKEGFFYPASIVHAVDIERTSLLEQGREMRVKIEYLETRLQSAYRAIEQMKDELKEKDLRMVAGKRKLKKTC